MSKGKIYIIGPMRGIKEHNYPAFNNAAKNLLDKDWEVENPTEINSDFCTAHKYGTIAELDMNDDLSSRLLLIKLTIISTCDAIYLLPGWERSKEAQKELERALYCRKKIIIGSKETESSTTSVSCDAGITFVNHAHNLKEEVDKLVKLELRANKKGTDEGSRNEVAVAKRKAEVKRREIKHSVFDTLPHLFKLWRESYTEKLKVLHEEICEIVKAAEIVIGESSSLDEMCEGRDIRDIVISLSDAENAFTSLIGKAKTKKTRKAWKRIEA